MSGMYILHHLYYIDHTIQIYVGYRKSMEGNGYATNTRNTNVSAILEQDLVLKQKE